MINKLILSLLLSTCCSLAFCAEYDESDLQKLFTDKPEREKIDAARSGKTVDKKVKKSDRVSISGYMTRSDGKSVVWMNNKNTLNKSTVDDVSVRRSTIGRDKKVTVTVGGVKAKIKPGETWHKSSGKIVDSY